MPVLEELPCRHALNRVRNMPFKWSLNPYRGCSHACHYCYARGTHEYLGLGAGEDFHTHILYKENLAAALERDLSRRTWRGETVAIGTATDPYQPAEARRGLTRAALQVFLKYRNPVSITTKGTLVVRDLPLLLALKECAGVTVHFSLNTLREDVWRAMEPGTPAPRQRLKAMQRLAQAGIHTGLFVAPILPGLTDGAADLESLAKAAAAHGAQFFLPSILRLPASTRPWFMAQLAAHFPSLVPWYRRLYRRDNAPEAYARPVLAYCRALSRRYGWEPQETPAPARRATARPRRQASLWDRPSQLS